MVVRVLVAGGINADIIASVPRLPSEHEKLRCGDYAIVAGSAAANTARGIARFGHEVHMVSCVGDDVLGTVCVDTLAGSGVNVSEVRRVEGAQTGLALVFIGQDSKRMVTFAGPDRNTVFDDISGEKLSAFGWLHVVSPPTESVKQLIHRAIGAGCSVSVEWNGQDMTSVVSGAGLHCMNRDELMRIVDETRHADTDTDTDKDTDTDTRARWLAKKLNAQVVITCGADGALWAQPDGKIIHQSTVAVEPVDRTGGGDAFDAGVISGCIAGETLAGCLRRGLELARETVLHIGA